MKEIKNYKNPIFITEEDAIDAIIHAIFTIKRKLPARAVCEFLHVTNRDSLDLLFTWNTYNTTSRDLGAMKSQIKTALRSCAEEALFTIRCDKISPTVNLAFIRIILHTEIHNTADAFSFLVFTYSGTILEADLLPVISDPEKKVHGVETFSTCKKSSLTFLLSNFIHRTWPYEKDI